MFLALQRANCRKNVHLCLTAEHETAKMVPYMKGSEGKSRPSSFVQRAPGGVMGYDRSGLNMVPEPWGRQVVPNGCARYCARV